MCALWHFRLGDRALDPWACGRRTARGESWSPVLADGEARRRFLFWTWRSAVAAATAARSFWPEGGLRILPSDMARALNGRISAERPLLESARKGGPVPYALCVPSRAREGHPSASGFDPGGAELWGLFGASRSKPLTEGWLWRVCALAFQAG